MKVVADWRRIMRHAWSVRLMLLAVLFEVGAVIAPMLADGSLVWTAVLTGVGGLFTTAAILSRFLAQKEFEDEQA